LTEEEIQENETLWNEERTEAEMPPATGQDLRGVGVTPADFESDITTGEEMNTMGAPGSEAAGGAPAPGSQPGAAVAPGATTPAPG
jgi:hypothetical protein